MKPVAWVLSFLLLITASYAVADDVIADAALDILVTFENHGASATGSSFSAPYRNRKRYSIAASARRNADDIASEYMLTEIDHWPIRSLSVYCFVYRVPSGQDRNETIERLRSDDRIESVQALQQFETGTENLTGYNDKYAGLQHGLDILGVSSAHRYSLGTGVRIAVIDSHADSGHEDLVGRIRKISVFAAKDRLTDENHGTAVTSIIGALSNNEKGIVGVAPEAIIELLVSCWAEKGSSGAVCDSFTIAKALDELLNDPPDILNLSLAGPRDPLLERLLDAVLQNGVIVVAADSEGSSPGKNFPAMLSGVIGVKSSGGGGSQTLAIAAPEPAAQAILAPGHQIMVALPDDAYDFRSGNSLAAAHVSGVIALLLAKSPNQTYASVLNLLRDSQDFAMATHRSIDACVVLYLAERAGPCPGARPAKLSLKLESGT
jgi:subtilisin family serine protease